MRRCEYRVYRLLMCLLLTASAGLFPLHRCLGNSLRASRTGHHGRSICAKVRHAPGRAMTEQRRRQWWETAVAAERGRAAPRSAVNLRCTPRSDDLRSFAMSRPELLWAGTARQILQTQSVRLRV